TTGTDSGCRLAFNGHMDTAIRHLLRAGSAALLLVLAPVALAQTAGACAAPTDTVAFPGAGLAAAVRSALELQPGAPIHCGALAGLRTLIANEAGITDLTGLEHATRLTRLDLRRNQLTDIAPVARLERLTRL